MVCRISEPSTVLPFRGVLHCCWELVLLRSQANLGPSWELDSRVGAPEEDFEFFPGGENIIFLRGRTDGRCEEIFEV